jgi:SDR family mycofactocin-dependent oxidoreductase
VGALDGRVALVTGGARGQGRSHAVALARAGARVVVCDACTNIASIEYPMATRTDLDETAKLVAAEGQECLALEADVRELEAIDAVVTEATQMFGGVDILIANAGVSLGVPVQATSGAQWSDVIDINLTGVFNAIRAVSAGMIERRYGRIVGISSMMGRRATSNIAAYTASKWGVIGLVKAAACDLASHGITVNAIAPGTVDTPMVQNDHLYRVVRPDLESPGPDDVAPFLAMLNPQNEAWFPAEEITRAVLFLVEEGARSITGAVLSVDSGAAAWFTG